MWLLRIVAFIGLAVLFVGTGETVARAACYDTIGCTDRNVFRERDLRTMSCADLYQMDSAIYGENGFCFKVLTENNASCRGYTKRAAVPLNRIERANIGSIDRTLRQKDCQGIRP
jgi:hypothetical protein